MVCRNRFLALASQAQKASLYGVEPASEEGKWTTVASNTLLRLAKEKRLCARVMGYDKVLTVCGLFIYQSRERHVTYGNARIIYKYTLCRGDNALISRTNVSGCWGMLCPEKGMQSHLRYQM